MWFRIFMAVAGLWTLLGGVREMVRPGSTLWRLYVRRRDFEISREDRMRRWTARGRSYAVFYIAIGTLLIVGFGILGWSPG